MARNSNDIRKCIRIMSEENFFNTFKVVCHVDGCFNQDVEIEISNPDETPLVMCGPCANVITDIVKVNQ